MSKTMKTKRRSRKEILAEKIFDVGQAACAKKNGHRIYKWSGASTDNRCGCRAMAAALLRGELS